MPKIQHGLQGRRLGLFIHGLPQPIFWLTLKQYLKLNSNHSISTSGFLCLIDLRPVVDPHYKKPTSPAGSI